MDIISMRYRHFCYNADDYRIKYAKKYMEGFPAKNGRKGKREVEERLTCQEAWKLNKDKMPWRPQQNYSGIWQLKKQIER